MEENTSTYESTETSERHYRRNFFLGVLNGTLFKGGLAFSHPSTVLPVFVSLFTGSSIIIGVTGTITSVGWLLPQIMVARYAEHLPTKMTIYKIAAAFRLLAWLGMILSLFWVEEIEPMAYLAIFFAFLGVYSLAGGASGIAFIDIVGKTVPPERRGRYFGYRNFFSGFIAAAAGILVAYVLGNPEIFPFPLNYMVLYSLTFVFILSAISLFTFVKEPEGSVKAEREGSSSEYLSNVRRLVSTDHNYRNFLIVMVLSYASSLSLPFYVIYARSVLLAPDSWVGIYVTVDMLATLVANLAWGLIGDRYGYRNLIRVCSFISLLAPVAALFAPSYGLFSLVFILKGSGSTGIWMAKNNYALEIAPIIRRATYLGVMNTALAFVMMLPIVGGLIIDFSGYEALFIVTAVAVGAAFLQASKLEEPRRANGS